jgi:hypothetical protein
MGRTRVLGVGEYAIPEVEHLAIYGVLWCGFAGHAV